MLKSQAIAMLEEHVVQAWFPRSIDRKYGGFLTTFDRSWRPSSTQMKLLEFQARQTHFAAEYAAQNPERKDMLEAACHGLRFVNDVMWDPISGTWFHATDREGRPTHPSYRNVHGVAYAISANAATYEITKDEAIAKRLQQGIDWLARTARDPIHDGYFNVVTVDGRPLFEPDPSVFPGAIDHCGYPYHCKNLNNNSDILEALTLAQTHLPSAQTHDMLVSLADIFMRIAEREDGRTPLFHDFAWSRSLASLVLYGNQFQTAGRLISALPYLPDHQRVTRIVRRLIERCFAEGRIAGLGLFRFKGIGSEPPIDASIDNDCNDVQWWTQFEALKTLALAQQAGLSDVVDGIDMAGLWAATSRYFIDQRFGGIYGELRLVDRRFPLFPSRGFKITSTNKGTPWKDCMHDGRALVVLSSA